MRGLALTAAAIVVIGLVGVLGFWAMDDAPSPDRAPVEQRSAGASSSGADGAASSDTTAGSGSTGSHPAGSDAKAGSGAAAGADTPAGSEAAASDAAPDDDPSGDAVKPTGGAQGGSQAFSKRLEGLLAKGDKAAFTELLEGWRTGSLSREQELALDEALANVEGAQLDELDKAAGRLFLDVPAHPERRKALASLLASSGSQLGARFLIEATVKAELEDPALQSLGTISDPEVLPVYRQHINADAPPELLNAISRSLRQMDTPKARALEQQIQALGK